MLILVGALGCASSGALESAIEAERSSVGQDLLNVSGHPQLFLDDYLIADSTNVKRVMNRPEKHPDNPLPFEPEYPWEMARMDPGCVIYDAERDVFRMWYTVLMDKARYADNFGYVCYAESSDGIHWEKPLFDIHPFEGHTPTNIIFKGPSRPNGECLFPSVIHMPEDTERPYKMLFTHRRSPENPSHYGLHTSTSKDGIHWKEPVLIFEGKCDNPPSLVWWPPLKKYFAYCRAQDSHPDMVGHIRSTGILESTDFETWTPRKKVVLTDERDGYPFTQFHHITVTSYGDLMVGMADVMHMEKDDNKTSTEDMQLISSRNGWDWNRVADRAVFIANGPGPYDLEIAVPRSPMVQKDDTIYIFYQGSSLGQRPGGNSGAQTAARGGLCLATLPADRLVGIERTAMESPGILETRAFTTTADDLVVNAALPSPGNLRVEVLDESGTVIEGYGRDSSQLAVRDGLRYTVRWVQGDLARRLGDATSEGPVAIRFVLDDGAFFAFQGVHTDAAEAAP